MKENFTVIQLESSASKCDLIAADNLTGAALHALYWNVEQK